MMYQRKSDWMAPVAAALALIACYGTLAAVGLLGALGVTIVLNQNVWAGVIVVFAWLSLLALWPGWRRHGLLLPIVIAAIGVVMITFTMTAVYEHAIEIAGFAFLCAGTYLDWRGKHRMGRQIG